MFCIIFFLFLKVIGNKVFFFFCLIKFIIVVNELIFIICCELSLLFKVIFFKG